MVLGEKHFMKPQNFKNFVIALEFWILEMFELKIEIFTIFESLKSSYHL